MMYGRAGLVRSNSSPGAFGLFGPCRNLFMEYESGGGIGGTGNQRAGFLTWTTW